MPPRPLPPLKLPGQVRCTHSSQHSRDAINYDRILALITSEIILNGRIYGRMDEWMNIFRDIPLFKPIRHSQSEERERKKRTITAMKR